MSTSMAIGSGTAFGAGPRAPTTSSTLPFTNAKAWGGRGDLAFVSLGQLFVLDGTDERWAAVTAPDAQASDPVFSPNRKWLAYSLDNGNGAGVSDADGSSPRTVTTAASGGPRWLPDNRLLVGSSIYDISTTGQVQPSGSAPSGLVGWSSGGTRYAFVTRKLTYAADGSFRGVEDLEVATSLTGPRTVWRSTPVSFHQSTGFHGNVVNGVLVLPGGEGILFWVDPDMSDAADGMHVFELRAPGAAPVDLGVTVGQDVSLAPHGVIAIGSGPNRYAWETKSVETCAITTAACRAVEGPANQLTFDPAWAPDGQTLAFVAAPPSTAASFYQSNLEQWYSTHRLWLLAAGPPGRSRSKALPALLCRYGRPIAKACSTFLATRCF